jgi:hypothetical protein
VLYTPSRPGGKPFHVIQQEWQEKDGKVVYAPMSLGRPRSTLTTDGDKVRALGTIIESKFESIRNHVYPIFANKLPLPYFGWEECDWPPKVNWDTPGWMRVWCDVSQYKGDVKNWVKWLKTLPDWVSPSDKKDKKSGAVGGLERVSRPAVSVGREYLVTRGWLGLSPSHPPNSSHVVHFAFNSTASALFALECLKRRDVDYSVVALVGPSPLFSLTGLCSVCAGVGHRWNKCPSEDVDDDELRVYFARVAMDTCAAL